MHNILKDQTCKEAFVWFEYAIGYLMAADSIAKQIKNKLNKDGEIIKIIEYMYIPLIFNLRHSLELILKSLIISTNISPKLTHNISKLFEIVQERTKDFDLKQINEISKIFDVEPKVIEEYLKISIRKIRDITSKYYCYEFLSKSKKNIKDEMNMLFRYPVIIENGIHIGINDLKTHIKIDEIIEEIEFLRDQIFIFVLFFGRTKCGKHILDALEKCDEKKN